ncbi:low molecular weight protein-tyrosine-phosphatase [Actinomadura sp. DC4]|uniref:low molecular weight protein-tyrosine-phosphatase n=1 Tax=Actinomadura sp. DC4 TaxID=3055069 RepID=UPI0025B08006|nr:low molecular weight protein-tyrosine-phosphatase [Actinomadura sp. DC4]MDN3359263.1 low molecular weight protein-tyrosine-phosphatase [Actinomadura sp. DC4]
MSYRVTFVCTGNICRSPMAEHIFRRHAEEDGLDVEADSSGTGHWHVGDSADERAVATLRKAGYRSAHRARQFEAAWFDRYDLIVALDQGHRGDLLRLAPDDAARRKVRLLREFDPRAGDLDVADPYYGRASGFETVREQIEAAVPGLLDHIRRAVKEQP